MLWWSMSPYPLKASTFGSELPQLSEKSGYGAVQSYSTLFSGYVAMQLWG